MRTAFALLGGFAVSALGLLIVIGSTQDLLGVILIAIGVGVAALMRPASPSTSRE